MTKLTSALLAALMSSIGCTDDPVYVPSPSAIEVTADAGTASGSLLLPIRLEEADEAERRAALAAQLGVMVPFVTRDDLELSVEWTVKNLSDVDGVARVQMNGANEWFGYNPAAFVVDEEEDAPPPLTGNVPLEIAAGQTRGGVFREDQLAEAALDLELITRGGFTPFAALLDVQEEMDEIDAAGVPVPSAAFAALVRVDMTLIADQHMVLEYAVRARDHREPPLLHEELLAAPPEELQPLAPSEFVPAAP
jgi:hypothetical protein